jgi:pimeloyl-ACP methyl ester carboxylesterase
MLGSRLPEGGLNEFFRRFREDLVLNVFEPVTRQAVAELPAALAELRSWLPIADAEAPLALVGGSMGACVGLSVLTETDLPVTAVALVSPAIRLASVVERYERLWGMQYEWSERSRAVAERLNFVARAEEIVAREIARCKSLASSTTAPAFGPPPSSSIERLRREYARSWLRSLGWVTRSPRSQAWNGRRRPRTRPRWTPRLWCGFAGI